MKTFKDSAGRAWTIDVNVGSLKRVRAVAQVDLLDVHDTALYPRILTDSVFAAGIAWAFVSDAAQKIPITQDQFDAALNETAAEEMAAAIVGAMHDFFLKTRPDVAAGISKMIELKAAMLPLQLQELDKMTAKRLMQSNEAKATTASGG